MIFNKKDLQAVVSAAGKGGGALGGVRMESDKIIGCDGHRLHMVRGEPSELAEPFTLGLDGVKRTIGGLLKDETTTPADVHTSTDVVDFPFPDYSKVIPQGEPERKMMISAKYLKEMADAAMKAEGPKADLMIFFYGKLEPIKMEGTEGRFLGVLMPQRWEK